MADRPRRNKFKFCGPSWILQELETKRTDQHLKTILDRVKPALDCKSPASYTHLDGRSRQRRQVQTAVVAENNRLLVNLNVINEQAYKDRTEKVVGRCSIGKVGGGKAKGPIEPFTDCYNATTKFIRHLPPSPKERILNRPEKNESQRIAHENIKLIKKIDSLRSSYDHKQLVNEYKESSERNDKIRYTMPIDEYMRTKVYHPGGSKAGSRPTSAKSSTKKAAAPPAAAAPAAAAEAAAAPAPVGGEDS